MTNAQLFIQGIRPKTLVAAIIPPVIAHSLFFKVTQKTDFYTMSLCLGLALFIQIATNFYNDAIDFKKGADTDRDGPKRVSSEQSLKKVFLFGHLSLFIAACLGIPLVIKGGVIFLLLGLISLFFAYGYTGGPFPLAYLGLGELFVFLFFGLLATTGSYYLMHLTVTWESLILGTIVGLLSCALIAINNFRDRKKDVLVGKNTLATKLRTDQYKILCDLFLFGPYILSLYFIIVIDLKYIALILATKYAQLGRKIITDHLEESELNLALEMAAKNLLFFGILFVLLSL